MTNTLVTVFGASGFVGRHIVRALAKEEWRIRAATRRPNLANFLTPAGHVGQIQLVKANVNDDESVARAVAGAKAVINLTGVLSGSGEQGFESINADAARRIGRCAREAGVESVVHLSAIGADPNADSGYAQSKGCGERFLREEFPDATILRPSLIFGPEDQFFNKFAALARYAPVLPLIGGGNSRFQPVYVADVAAAVVKALTLGEARGETYEIGGPKTYSFKELLQFTLRETGRRNLLMPVPFFAASVMAIALTAARAAPELVRQIFKVPSPPPLLTLDQVRMLRTDNVVASGAKSLADLGIEPKTLEAVAPSYLWRFHPKGQFKDQTRPVAP
jgi:NADH dehydrogenase